MKIYCSGIGGIGLSAYAAQMRARGHEVSGSDRSDSATVEDLRSQGVKVILIQDGSGVGDDVDLLVYSEAIPVDAPERAKAKKLGIRQISYFAALGELTKGTTLIAVCGTHGKSSTTAMTAKVLIEAGLDPNIVVGTKLKELSGRNWRRGSGNLWVVEACEYRRSFLYLSPSIILVTNADGDHFDAFKDQSDYEFAFQEFFSKLPSGGVIIAHGGDAQVQNIIKHAEKEGIDADREPLATLATPGQHMRSNAQLVLALSRHLGLSEDDSRRSLSTFSGTWRRMEMKGVTKDGVTVIDDYAHHPTEIRATLSAMREAYPGHRLICAFQPHTHDRTLKLWKDFAQSFKDADVVLVTDIYDARPDRDAAKANVNELAAAIGKSCRCESKASGSVKETETLLRSDILKHDDILITMGAGTITDLATAMLA